jgi:hypothetical protein
MDRYVFKEHELEAVDDSNGTERYSEIKESKLIKAIFTLVDEIDTRDRIYGNDVKLNQVRNLANNCFKENNFQLNHNWKQQRVFDLKFTGKKNRQPLEAA